MDVAPHPHIGLQTVSWLFAGEVEHRDSAGVHTIVRPGEVNLMSAGFGISHSEVSTPSTQWLHGVQLWIVQPSATRRGNNGFQHFAASPHTIAGGASARVFIGSIQGVGTSPVVTDTPLVGAEIEFNGAAEVSLPLDETFEHGILVDHGSVRINGGPAARNTLSYLAVGRDEVTVSASGPARLILIGGQPFTEPMVMWWNFVGRSHDEIAQARDDWQTRTDRFGHVEGYVGGIDWIPAPPMPGVRLTARTSQPLRAPGV